MGGSSSGGGGLGRALSKAMGPQMGAAQAPTRTVSQAQEEEGGRVRGARRRGRQLLSDARLKAESNMETLGSGQQL